MRFVAWVVGLTQKEKRDHIGYSCKTTPLSNPWKLENNHWPQAAQAQYVTVVVK